MRVDFMDIKKSEDNDPLFSDADDLAEHFFHVLFVWALIGASCFWIITTYR